MTELALKYDVPGNEPCAICKRHTERRPQPTLEFVTVPGGELVCDDCGSNLNNPLYQGMMELNASAAEARAALDRMTPFNNFTEALEKAEAAPPYPGEEAVKIDINRGKHEYAKYALLMAGLTMREAYRDFVIDDDEIRVPNHLVRKAQKYIADFDEVMGLRDGDIPF